jgi:dTDP-4-amino-4,6-dideoxygalactose transaminase
MFPNADWIFERLISIPLSASMTKADAHYVAATVKKLITKYNK